MADVLCPLVVGRDTELALLRSALDAARGGGGGQVFIIGRASASPAWPARWPRRRGGRGKP